MADRHAYAIGGAIVLAALLLAGPARADRIDGDWCSPDNRFMSIEGVRIVTPGGQRIHGNYDRHAYSYTVPAAEAAAGATVAVVLLNEEQVRVQVGEGPAQIWRRCSRPSS